MCVFVLTEIYFYPYGKPVMSAFQGNPIGPDSVRHFDSNRNSVSNPLTTFYLDYSAIECINFHIFRSSVLEVKLHNLAFLLMLSSVMMLCLYMASI